MKKSILVFILFLLFQITVSNAAESGIKFTISFPAEFYAEPVDGRMLLLISINDEEEPRFQISQKPETQLAFGINIDGLKP